MLSDDILISFAIPTYNGEETIKETIVSILDAISFLPLEFQNKLEIVIVDDLSTDNTRGVLSSFVDSKNILIEFNDKRLGMDLNFRKVALLSQGEYVWFFGQDDLILKYGLLKVVNAILSGNPNIISLNYTQIDSSGSVLNNSCLNNISRGSLKTNYIYKFSSCEDYFRIFSSAPTFLPATIMRRSFWEKFDHKPFVGTCYVQVACILSNMNKGDIFVVTDNLIIGLVPDDKWQSDGNELFKIMLGSLRMQNIIFYSIYNPLPKSVFNKSKKNFLLRLYFLLGESKKRGYQVDLKDMDHLFSIYKKNVERNYIKFIFKLNNVHVYNILNGLKKIIMKQFNVRN